jgi:hypothetical protein
MKLMAMQVEFLTIQEEWQHKVLQPTAMARVLVPDVDATGVKLLYGPARCPCTIYVP